MNLLTNSIARSKSMILDPKHRTFISSCSTPWTAEYRSWQTAALTPLTLLAAILAPTPLPHMIIPLSKSDDEIPLATRIAESG